MPQWERVGQPCSSALGFLGKAEPLRKGHGWQIWAPHGVRGSSKERRRVGRLAAFLRTTRLGEPGATPMASTHPPDGPSKYHGTAKAQYLRYGPGADRWRARNTLNISTRPAARHALAPLRASALHIRREAHRRRAPNPRRPRSRGPTSSAVARPRPERCSPGSGSRDGPRSRRLGASVEWRDGFSARSLLTGSGVQSRID